MRLLSGFVAILFLLGAPAFARAATVPAPVDRIVAVVNNEVITLKELQERMAMAERQLRQQNVQLPPRDVLERQVLERMIVDQVQLQLAKETALRIDDAQLERALSNIAQSNRMSLAQFRATLERDGIPWSKFREDIRQEMTIARLREREVDSRVTVSEGEVDNFLASAESKGGSEEFNLSHILLRTPEQASPEQLARVRERAEEIVAQLRRGRDFAQLAAAYSDAPDALGGGNLGWRRAAG
jgi:peptidyl-prolyl cis-trans isomerase SurA